MAAVSKPLIAIVGRPNVGKSMLFNRITGKRLSIVEDTPGVTRDRLYATGDWSGRDFNIVDTGGIEPTTDNEILLFMREQALLAIDMADVIILVTDITTGVTAADQDVANMLLRSRKPVVLAVNKMDSVGPMNPDIYEFYALGLGDPIAVSAAHGHGTNDLLDACLEYFPPETEIEEEEDVIHVAIIGKPNVGKSSLVNRILGETRVIVSDVAGTTRDAVDTPFENDYGKYVFIDTAGIRRKSKVDDRIEKYSVMRAQLAIERADVCLIMIDAREGVTEQDTKVAGLAHEAGKASIIVVNKWDLIEKETNTMDRMREDVLRDLSYMSYAPVLFISAKSGQRVERIFELINSVSNNASMRITTGMLNNVLSDATARVQPPTDKGRRLKIYYMTQTGVRPPTFVCFCNDASLFHFSYQRYLENQIRSVFGLEGTPVRMVIRQKGDSEG
jgi:GTP-binding protein